MVEVCKVVDCSTITAKPTGREKIALAFPEEPRMVNVAYCESRHKQFDKRGKTLMSETSDVGILQINQVHWPQAKKLGLDIFNSEDDNIKMGRIIYDMQGIKAWYALKSECYKNLVIHR